MTETKTASRRPSAATIALIAAGLLAAVALGYRFWPGGGAEGGDSGNASASAAPRQAGDLDEMVAALTERARQDPDDHQTWFQLGVLLRNSGRYLQAEQAFRRASELAPDNADYLTYRAEIMLVMARRSQVPPEAEQLLRRAIAIAPANPQTRYLLATLRDMRGDHRGAVDEMIAILRDAPPGAVWEEQVRTAAVGIAREHDIAIEGRLPAPRAAPPSTSTATAAIPGPTREQMESARAIPPGDQDAMVRGMVDRLAARLRQNPRNEEGWIRLMRSRMVLNDPEAARAALGSAVAAFNGDAAAQTRLRGAARALGVPGAG